MRRSGWMMVLAGTMVAGGAAGCSSTTTETGYTPNKIGMSDGQRRALYAPKYSPEAAQAQAERDAESKARKPGGLFQ